MKTKHTFEIDLPTWALGALVNGNREGLTDDDKKHLAPFEEDLAKAVQEYGGKCHVLSTGENEFFTHYPEFGLAGTCVECTVKILA